MTDPISTDAPATRLQPGGRRMQHAVTWLLGVVVLCALAAGAPALIWAGGMAGLPVAMRGLTVAVVDGVLVVMSLAAVTRRGRGERAAWMWTSVGVLVVGSAAVQAVHALTVTTATTTAARVVAAGIGALPPAITLLASHGWLDLAVAPAPTKRRTSAARTSTARATTTGAPTTTPAPSTTATKAPRRAPATTSSRSVVDPVKRVEAEAMLAAGRSVAATAKALGLAESSVRRWRDAMTTVDDATPVSLFDDVAVRTEVA